MKFIVCLLKIVIMSMFWAVLIRIVEIQLHKDFDNIYLFGSFAIVSYCVLKLANKDLSQH